MLPVDPHQQQRDWALTELQRRLANVIRLGFVHDADYPAARLRVRYAGTPDSPVLTGWLRWIAPRAGPDREWDAPEVGEQVVVFSASGDLDQGLVLAGIFRDAYPALESVPTKHTRRYDDGAVFSYDREAHHLEATLPAGSSATIESDAVTVRCATATINASGQVRVNGSSINLN